MTPVSSPILTSGLGRAPAEFARPPTTVTTWRDQRASLEGSGVNRVLEASPSRRGRVGAVVLALLAVGFAVLAGRRPGR